MACPSCGDDRIREDNEGWYSSADTPFGTDISFCPFCGHDFAYVEEGTITEKDGATYLYVDKEWHEVTRRERDVVVETRPGWEFPPKPMGIGTSLPGADDWRPMEHESLDKGSSGVNDEEA
jgi:hypothetical protein